MAGARPSIVIRCFDEEKHIGRLLEGVFHQSIPDPEVILVDSGSSDRTLEIAGQYGVRVVHISSKDFSFGRSLNLGCRAATGEVLVFISAHCYPTYDDWLERLVEPFSDPGVGVVYGKQRGNEKTRFSEHRLFEQWFPDDSVEDQRHPFANNANCAVRRSRWLEHPYDEGLTGLEDIAWTKDALGDGCRVVYAPAAEIVHVHEERPGQIYNRYRREAIALRSILVHETFGMKDLVALSTSSIWKDLQAARRAGVLKGNLLDIFVFRTMQYWGTFRGFQMHGPVESELKRKLYYPHPPRAGEALSAPAGREIPYALPSE